MFYYRYSPEQLERAAEQLLQKFDPELLKKPKEYDVYRVIEECLGVDYDWKYIRPDQAILGLTAFNPGYIWVSPAPHLYEGSHRVSSKYLCSRFSYAKENGSNRVALDFWI